MRRNFTYQKYMKTNCFPPNCFKLNEIHKNVRLIKHICSVENNLRGSSQKFGIFFIIGPILLKFSHNM